MKICKICKITFQPNPEIRVDYYCSCCRKKYGRQRLYRVANNANKPPRNSTCKKCGGAYTIRGSGRPSLYCQTCKEMFSASARWAMSNPEKAREVRAKYRKGNLEVCRARGRACQIKHNDQKRFGGFRESALMRDSYKCQMCLKDVSKPFEAIVHHINHNKNDNRLENFQTLCHSCHAKHHITGNRDLAKKVGKHTKKMWELHGKKYFNR